MGFVARSDWKYLPRHAQERLNEADEPEAGAVDLGSEGPAAPEAKSAGNYYMNASEKGEPAGRWFGTAVAAVGFTEGDVVTSRAMETVYGKLQNKAGDQLGSKPRTYASHEERVAKLLEAEPDATPERRAEIEFQARKAQREACHYYDLTFTPEKSWSVLYAGLQQAGMQAEADELWNCLTDAYKQGLSRAMDEACFARTGRHSGKIADRTSGRWEKAPGWVATLWQHHTSRAGDPNLHIHGAVLNRVQLVDGSWYALDGTALKNMRRSMASSISRLAEGFAHERLGLHFEARADGKGREIAGVDAQLIEQFSSRRRAISPEAQRIAQAYQEKYGREPSAYELRSFAQQATLLTRDRKPDHPPTGPELLQRWEQTVRDRFGASLADVVLATGLRPLAVPAGAGAQADVQAEHAHPDAQRGPDAQVPDAQHVAQPERQEGSGEALHTPGAQADAHPDAQAAHGTIDAQQLLDPVRMLDAHLRIQVVEDALADVTTRLSVWRRDQITAAIDTLLPVETLEKVPAKLQPVLLDRLTDEALNHVQSVKLSAAPLVEAPAVWRRDSDGRGFHEPPARYDRYSSTEVLAQEDRLVQIAEEHGAAVADANEVEEQILASGLRPDQRAVVRTILTSGRRVDTIIGPAGAGKSYTLGQLARIWENTIRVGQGDDEEPLPGRVIGLATAQNAAQVLNKDGITHTLNTKQFIENHQRLQEGKAIRPEVREVVSLSPADLVILDEASMVSREDARAIAEAVAAAGAKLVPAGDDRQLQAVEAGGAFDVLVERTRPLRLNHVERFVEAWEGPASLRLRAGDASVIYEYARRGRIREGSEDRLLAEVQRRYVADHLSGRESLIICGTNEQAADVASRIRAELVERGQVQPDGVRLDDRTIAGVGDLIQTRKNDRDLADGAGGWVTNRDVYRVEQQNLRTGALRVSRYLGRDDVGEPRWGAQTVLPAGYVAEHVQLAYASTAHAAEGRTVDRGYAVVGGSDDPGALYVAGSRGRESNLLFVITEIEAPDPLGHEDVDESKTTPEAVLAGILERPRQTLAASQVLAEEVDARESLARLAPEWHDLIVRDANARYRSHLTALLSEEQAGTLAEDPAEGPLLRAVRNAELAGRDPRQLLEQVITARELDSAGSIGQVLHHRIKDETATVEPIMARSYLERTPKLADPDLSAYAKKIAAAMDERVTALGERAIVEQPAWAAPLGPVPDEPVDRLEWTRRAGIIAGYREEQGWHNDKDALGPAPHTGAPDARQSWMAAYDALGRPSEQRDTAAKSDGELRNQLREWERAEAAGPKNVDTDLRDAHQLRDYCDTEARLLAAQIDQAREAGHAIPDELTAELAEYHSGHRQAEEQIPDLERAAAERAEWYEQTRAERRSAHLARKELDRRRTAELDQITDPETDVSKRQQADTADREPAAVRTTRDRQSEREIDHTEQTIDTSRSAHRDVPGRAGEPIATEEPDQEPEAGPVEVNAGPTPAEPEQEQRRRGVQTSEEVDKAVRAVDELLEQMNQNHDDDPWRRHGYDDDRDIGRDDGIDFSR